MFINRFIGCIIVVVSFIIFATFETSAADDFKLDKFIGLWYSIGVIVPKYNNSTVIRFYQINIVKSRDYDQRFTGVITYNDNGVPKTIQGYGRFNDSKIIYYFPSQEKESVYTVESYEDGQELILSDTDLVTPYYELLSRTCSILVETKKEFQKIAASLNVDPIYFDHDC